LTRTIGIRLLFGCTVALFAVQLLLIADEPYPALTMPTFTGHPLEGDIILVEKPEFRVQFASGQAEVVPYESFLPETPLDALPIFKNAFPFYDFAIDADTLAWLESNAVRKFPGRTPSGVDIVWRKAAHDVNSPGSVTYATVRTVHLDFAPER
jgi:hypothetical protein